MKPAPPDAALKLLTFGDAAKLCGVPPEAVKAAADAGALRTFEVSPRTHRTTRAWLYEWIYASPTHPQPSTPSTPLDLSWGASMDV